MLPWTNDQILLWLRNAQYSEEVVNAFRSNNITGLVLPFLNMEELKEMGINGIQIRLRLMKDIGNLLLEKNAGFLSGENSHPVLTQLQSTMLATTLISIIAQDIRDDVISGSEHSNKSLVHQFSKLREDLLPILKEIKDKKPLPHPEAISSDHLQSDNQPNTINSQGISNPSYNETAGLSDTATISSLPSTGEVMTAEAAVRARPKLVSRPEKEVTQPIRTTLHKPVVISRGDKTQRRHSKRRSGTANEPLKQLRARKEDKCYKILQAAMKSHGLDISEWKNYALVIVYGGDQERILGYEEKPVLIFKELKEMGLSPSMMLRQVDEGDSLDYTDFDTPGGRL